MLKSLPVFEALVIWSHSLLGKSGLRAEHLSIPGIPFGVSWMERSGATLLHRSQFFTSSTKFCSCCGLTPNASLQSFSAFGPNTCRNFWRALFGFTSRAVKSPKIADFFRKPKISRICVSLLQIFLIFSVRTC